MTDFTQQFPYHPIGEKVLNILRTKSLNKSSDTYFRVLIGYYFAQMASNMRCNVKSNFFGDTPVNVYCMCFMQSGAGKSASCGYMEEAVINQFIEKFKKTFNTVAALNMERQANLTSIETGVTKEEALRALEKEFKSYGTMPYSFDSGTSAAFKQVRAKAQIAGIGALSMVCDELGSVLTSLEELLIDGLTIFDKGRLKQKITKNTADNVRAEERNDPVPCNMLLFGEPSKLFDGAVNEKLILQYLTTGYARRSFFATGSKTELDGFTPEELYDLVTNESIQQDAVDLSDYFGTLADTINRDKWIPINKENTLILIEYRTYCETRAKQLGAHEDTQKFELQHRYYKVLKLAGAYAFVDGSPEITKDQILAAIQLAEDSGKCFQLLLHRDKPYVKLAKFISEAKKPLTHADLSELPYYPQAKQKQNDLLALASAWGYDHNIAIKRCAVEDGIEFISAVSLPETKLDELIISYSCNITEGYLNNYAPFKRLHELCTLPNYYWCNHFLDDYINERGENTGGYRNEEHSQRSFNLLVLDCDGGVTLKVAQTLLSRYTYFMYTTKRHQKEGNGDRFRIVLPIKYTLDMDKQEYSDFMKNVYKWLPFELDECTFDRCRAWKSNPGTYFYNEADLLDPTPFIPKTVKNLKFTASQQKFSDLNLGNLERWFLSHIQEGSRNNMLHRYAMILKDMDKELIDIEEKVKELNSKLENPLKEEEIDNTIMKSIVGNVK